MDCPQEKNGCGPEDRAVLQNKQSECKWLFLLGSLFNFTVGVTEFDIFAFYGYNIYYSVILELEYYICVFRSK